ncbi:MAG: glycosyltransferase family 2 protein [Ignavibacteriaceae bacterium]
MNTHITIGDKAIAGVVVLYNPHVEVIQNINSYINQINFLFIIDNSEKRNYEIAEYFQNHSGVEYIFNEDNLGVAAALNIGAKKADEQGCTYLLTMDQDSKAPPGMIETFLEGMKIFKGVGLISPFHYNEAHSLVPSAKKYTTELAVMTSGNLLNLLAFKDIGGFNEDYFIDHVDTEYCLRLNMMGYKLIQCNEILLQHNEASPIKKNLFYRTVYLYNHSPIRFYYKARNRQYLKKYKRYFPELFRVEAQLFWRTLLKVILFENEKILKLKMATLGYIDYLKGKTGRFEK